MNRRKKISAGLIALMLAAIPSAVFAADLYIPGTYSGTGQGFGGMTEVSVEVTGTQIMKISIVSNQDTPAFFDRCIPALPDRIIAAQSTKVDAVSGATFSSNGIIAAVNAALKTAAVKPDDPVEPVQIPELAWVNSFGGRDSDNFYAACETQDGGFAVCGYSDSNDNHMAGAKKGLTTGIVAKYSEQGAVEWISAIGGTPDEFANTTGFYDIAQAENGDLIAVGYSQANTGDFENRNKGTHDAVVVRLSAEGNLAWVRDLGSASMDHFYSVAVTPDGGLIAAGDVRAADNDFAGLVKKDSSTSISDAVLVKMNGRGDVEWMRSLGGNGSESFEKIRTVSSGGYIAVGRFNSYDGDFVAVRKAANTSTREDGFIAKFSELGEVEWISSVGGTQYDELHDVIESSSGFVAVGFSNSITQDLVGLNKGKRDAIVTAFDHEGNMKWIKTYGSSQDDFAESIALTPEGNYRIAVTPGKADKSFVGLSAGRLAILEIDRSGELRFIHNQGSTGEGLGFGFNENFWDLKMTENGMLAVGWSNGTDGDFTGRNLGGNDGIIAYYKTAAQSEQGDVNDDGAVSLVDIALALTRYGKTSTDPEWKTIRKADMDRNGIIDMHDLNAIAEAIR